MFKQIKKAVIARKIKTLPIDETVEAWVGIVTRVIKADGDIFKQMGYIIKSNSKEVAEIVIAVSKITDSIKVMKIDVEKMTLSEEVIKEIEKVGKSWSDWAEDDSSEQE